MEWKELCDNYNLNFPPHIVMTHGRWGKYDSIITLEHDLAYIAGHISAIQWCLQPIWSVCEICRLTQICADFPDFQCIHAQSIILLWNRLKTNQLSVPHVYRNSNYCSFLHNPFHSWKQAERLKSCERRPEVNRLDGQWAQWSIGLMFNGLNGW